MRRFLFLIPFLFLQYSCKGDLSQNSDIEILKSRLIEDALKLTFRPRTDRYIISDFTKAGFYLDAMDKNGSWADIDYTDEDNNWAPLKHLNRLLVMTIAYESDKSASYRNQNLLKGIELSIQYWYKVNPRCRNWYKNDIAKQFYFNIIGLLLQGQIEITLHKKIVNDLTAAPSMTGSNRTLVASSTIYRGVLENNPIRVRDGIKGVTDQIIVTTEEGIQPDYSFHQHGHFIYNGSYGHNFLRESIWLATIVHDTEFEFSKAQIETLRNYYLEGTKWMLRGSLIDYNVRGRQVGRPEGDILLGEKIIPQLNQYMIADPDYQKHYQVSKEHIQLGTPQAISGNRHFWRSDYTVHHRESYFTSLKMCSERTVGIELNMNSENKLGYWLPYGLTYIYRKGDEYQGIFPAWDWGRLPGVTNPYYEYEEHGKGVAYSQETTFVGGVSDETFGVSVMNFEKDSTKAKKAWFWFDEEWVALGAGIESSSNSAIVTGINQCLQKGNIIVDGKPYIDKSTGQFADWIVHDEIAYVFPQKTHVNIKGEVQKGNLQRIYGLGVDSIYSPQVFSLWLDHGKKPRDASYAYIVVPGKTANEMSDYTQNLTVKVLSNDSKIQAVSQGHLKMLGVVFHEAGLFEDKETSLKVTEPCLVLFNRDSGEIHISDPTTKLAGLRISVTIKDKPKWEETVTFPLNGLAGKSVKLSLGN